MSIKCHGHKTHNPSKQILKQGVIMMENACIILAANSMYIAFSGVHNS